MAKTRKLTHHKRHHIKSKSLKRTYKRKPKLVKKRRTRRTKKNTKKRKMKVGGGWFKKSSSVAPAAPAQEPEPEHEHEHATREAWESKAKPIFEQVKWVTDEEVDKENKRLLTELNKEIKELTNSITKADKVLEGPHAGWDESLQILTNENEANKKKLKKLVYSLEHGTYKTTKEELQKERNEKERRANMSDYEKWVEDGNDPMAYSGGKRRRKKRRKTKKGTKH